MFADNLSSTYGCNESELPEDNRGSRAMSAVYDSLARRGLVQVDVTSTQIESPDGSTGPAGKV